MSTEWSAFYGGLAGFAGTVFAITLAARTIRQSEEVNENYFRNQTRLWDSISVTFELAAAALFAILVAIRGTFPASFFAVVVTGVGVLSYVLYLRAFLREHRNGIGHRWTGWLLFAWTVFPLSAYFISAFYFLEVPLCGQAGCLPVDEVLFPLSIGYLVLSGVGQAFLWYLRTWEKP